MWELSVYKYKHFNPKSKNDKKTERVIKEIKDKKEEFGKNIRERGMAIKVGETKKSKLGRR